MSDLGFVLSLDLLRDGLLGSCLGVGLIFNCLSRLGSVHTVLRLGLVFINDSSDTCIFVNTFFLHFVLSCLLLFGFQWQWYRVCLLIAFLNVHWLFFGGY